MRLPKLQQALSGVVDFVYPPLCAICGVRLVPFESELCDACRAEVLPTPLWRCRLCGATDTVARPHEDGPCPFCPPAGSPIRGILSAAPYRAEAARCVHLFKYDRRLEMGRVLGRMLVARLSEPVNLLQDRVDWIVPVPLHWRRRAWRGFNQARILAVHLSSATGIPLETRVLRRIRATRMQVRVPAGRRAENVRGAFALTRAARPPLPGILLVDDVVTGGHTVTECARVLRRAGAPEIWVASFARAGRMSAGDSPWDAGKPGAALAAFT